MQERLATSNIQPIWVRDDNILLSFKIKQNKLVIYSFMSI